MVSSLEMMYLKWVNLSTVDDRREAWPDLLSVFVGKQEKLY